MPSGDQQLPDTLSTDDEIAAFVARSNTVALSAAAAGGAGRLLFAMDATASREPTWDVALDVQAGMFDVAGSGLSVQLMFYRGFGELKKTSWLNDAASLRSKMLKVRCLGGRTQIGRVFDYVLKAPADARPNVLVLVGDCVEEDIDRLCDQAGRLGLMGVKGFFFHEGHDPTAALGFKHFARLSGGAAHPFDVGSPALLRTLLAAAARYATGGEAGLRHLAVQGGEPVLRLTQQLGGQYR